MFTTKKYLNISVVKFLMKMRDTEKKTPTFFKYWEFYTKPKPALVQKYSRINVYNELSLPVFACESETWTLRENDKKRLT